MKMAESFPNRKKTLWEKEKLLIMSNFSLSHCVFKRPVFQTRKNQGLLGKGLKGKIFLRERERRGKIYKDLRLIISIFLKYSTISKWNEGSIVKMYHFKRFSHVIDVSRFKILTSFINSILPYRTIVHIFRFSTRLH